MYAVAKLLNELWCWSSFFSERTTHVQGHMDKTKVSCRSSILFFGLCVTNTLLCVGHFNFPSTTSDTSKAWRLVIGAVGPFHHQVIQALVPHVQAGQEILACAQCDLCGFVCDHVY